VMVGTNSASGSKIGDHYCSGDQSCYNFVNSMFASDSFNAQYACCSNSNANVGFVCCKNENACYSRNEYDAGMTSDHLFLFILTMKLSGRRRQTAILNIINYVHTAKKNCKYPMDGGQLSIYFFFRL